MSVKINYPTGVLSNKNKTTPKTPIKAASAPSPYPFIDRMSVTLTIPSKEDAHDIHSNIWEQLTDKEVFWSGVKKKGGYKTAVRVIIPGIVDTQKWPLLQYNWDKTTGAGLSFRTEFNPVDIDPDGLAYFHGVLRNL